MSEPPPGAVLMTNSTGRVGCSTPAAADAEPAALPDGAPDAAGFWPPQAAMSRPALMTARKRLPLACNITQHLHGPVRSVSREGSMRSDQSPDAKGLSVPRKPR